MQKHNFKIGDLVSHPVDASPFKVVGIREDTVEIYGDWSGGTHNSYGTSCVHHTEIKHLKDA